MMKDAISHFAEQFELPLKIQNPSKKRFKKFIVAGMGGSHLGADLIKTIDPSLDLMIHSSYGLPTLQRDQWKDRFVIASSYSGNTEETIDAFFEARKRKFPLAAISVGGKLKVLAIKHKVPYVELPDLGIQPRMASGISTMALLKLMGRGKDIKEAEKLSKTLLPEKYSVRGKTLAETLKGKVPIIYSSAANLAIAYNWKIKFNETGKIPAFYNVLPELNHNEMTGFDVHPASKALSAQSQFIFLEDPDDHPRIQKRMNILGELYASKGLAIEKITLERGHVFHKIFSSLVLADWTAYYTAEQYGLEAEQVPMVEEFKRRMA